MRKNFLLLFMMMLMPFAAWAADAPTVGTMVGQSVVINGKAGIVTYKVNGAFVADGSYYPVTITGLDADGLEALKEAQATPAQKIALEIPVSFNEKYGDSRYNYAVTLINDGLDGATRQAFYGYTEISSLKFVNPNVEGKDAPAVALDKFTYTVGQLGAAGEGKTFYGCSNMQTLEFTENCTAIAEYSFQNTAISTFQIPKKCATIEANAFYNCQSLNSVTVEAGNAALATLDDYVFANSSLRRLDLSGATALTTIGTLGNSPFLYTGSVVNDVLTWVKLPASVKDINDSFAKCTALTAIEGLEETALGAAVGGTHIINGAFAGCRALTELNLPDCDVIGAPFVGCVALKTLNFKKTYTHEIYKTAIANNNLFGVYKPAEAGYAANDQNALENVIFHEAFQGKIMADAFVGMTGLKKVEFKKELQKNASIGAAFTNVESLATLTFNGIDSNGAAADDGVTIGANAFHNTGIVALAFGTVKITGAGKDITIDENAFSDCANLATVAFGDFTFNKLAKFNIKGTAFTANPLLNTVTFGNATFNQDGRVNIYDDAFATGNVKLATVKFGTVASANGKTGTIIIGADDNTDLAAPVLDNDVLAANAKTVFGDGEHLTTVEFGKGGDLVTGMFISSRSFASTGLTSVEFGSIKAANQATATGFIIGQSAFEGGNTADKTVKIGTIKDNGIGALSFVALQDAFAAKMLKSVEIGDMEVTNIAIGKNAFANATLADYATNDETLLATQNLQTVTLGNMKAGIAASTFGIEEGAFWGGKAAAGKTVKIGKIEDNTTSHKALTVGFGENAFAGQMLNSVEIAKDGMAAASVSIAENAFANMKKGAQVPATQNLQSVEIGNITASNEADATLTIATEAFWGGSVADKTVTIGTITDKSSTTKHTTTVQIADNAFVGQSLKTVNFATAGMSAKKIEIGENAFANKKNTDGDVATQNLQTVTLGNIIAGNEASTFEAKKQAFWGGKAAAKSVTVGEIKDASTTATLTASFGEEAAAGEQLTNVKIGNMTATSLAIVESAFSGAQLVNVDLGDMTAATLTVAANAFANTNENDVLNETIKIGELKTANFTGAKAFQGPTKAGSSYAVEIKSITGAVTIPANTFVAPAKGTATYTVLGDLAAGSATNIAEGAFVGSQENVLTPVKNTTSVKFQGDYNANLEKGVFTNVNDVEVAVAADGTAKNLGTNTYLRAFKGAKYVTLGNNGGHKVNGATVAYTGNIAEIVFLGNVESAGSIESFASTKVRKIEFKNVESTEVKVAAKAIAAKAFAKAADAALAPAPGENIENITVIYREQQTRDAVNIFDGDAFVDATMDDNPAVTLYTSDWAKTNIYESTSDALNWKVNRLTFSASSVAPGEDIKVKVYKRADDVYAYGKLYLPKGSNMKYKLSAEITGTGTDAINSVQLYYGRIDKSKNAIYMHSVPTIDGYYWIDATEVDQAFMVRTKGKDSGTEITAEPVTEEEDALFAGDTTGDYVYFDKNFAKYNQFRYNTQKIANQNLLSDAEFLDTEVYYLANPTKRGFAFIHLDKAAGDNLASKSLYIVGKILPVAGTARVIFDDEPESETTGIENVNAEDNNEGMFNLQGIRVSGAQKGLYIKNGKKVVIK